MNLTEDSKIRPIDCFSPVVISNWCRDYLRYNKYPASLLERFAIGFYQIHQGMEWPDSLNKAESNMSAVLHFMMVAEMLSLNLEVDFSGETKLINYQRLLHCLSKAQQQIFYKHKAAVKSTDGRVYQRASRYKASVTGCNLLEAISILVAAVPSYRRAEGLFHASKIMSGTL